MDGQQYLDQISNANAPKKAKPANKRGILHNKFFIVGMIGVGLLLLIVILGAILGGGKDGEKSLSSKLYLHLDGTAAAIQEYQNYVRSSDLRSSSASLYGVLTDTSSGLEKYLTEKYDIKKVKDTDKKLQEKATAAKDELTGELFEAKINGILDRTFAHKMAYEISIIKAEESELYNKTNSEVLKEVLNKSHESLTNLYDKFNDFSETKN
ncbi:hypothetical protein IKF89_00550 [Candidatus Saccharibacteria bacterium]|nr:hypothetical protein [Candidatus Saccharibacteria bacterium]